MTFYNDYSLKTLNSFGFDVKAAHYTEVQNISYLRTFFGMFAGEPWFVLGGGNNILFTRDVTECVLHIQIKGLEVLSETSEHVLLRVGAGEDWDSLVAYCADRGWGGLENLSLIPGQAGSAPIQNIGAYGAEVKDHIEEVSCFDTRDQSEVVFSNAECLFGYRSSIFKTALRQTHIITSVVFRLSKKPVLNLTYAALSEALSRMKLHNPTIADIRQIICDVRRSKLPDPAVTGNAGSFFKNPVTDVSVAEALCKDYPDAVCYPQSDGAVKIAAGWLIQAAGWKGYREGDAGVHDKQALVLVNHGKATGEQLFLLSQKIKESVKARFGIELETEVNIY